MTSAVLLGCFSDDPVADGDTSADASGDSATAADASDGGNDGADDTAGPDDGGSHSGDSGTTDSGDDGDDDEAGGTSGEDSGTSVGDDTSSGPTTESDGGTSSTDGGTTGTCGQPCETLADCSAGEACIENGDGLVCAAQECQTCSNNDQYCYQISPVNCTFVECSRCFEPCMNDDDCPTLEFCHIENPNPGVCKPDDCQQCYDQSLSCQYDPRTCTLIMCTG